MISNIEPGFANLPSRYPSSRGRSLLRDVEQALGQQMYFWGCDADHPQGNLLVRSGMERIARMKQLGEGSSQYRCHWQDGVIELHSFCVGWYPSTPEQVGSIYIRRNGRLSACIGGHPMTPGKYEDERFCHKSTDALCSSIRPLISWLSQYEVRVIRIAGQAYRENCWKNYLKLPAARGWLPPEMALRWYKSYLSSPDRTPRSKAILHCQTASI